MENRGTRATPVALELERRRWRTRVVALIVAGALVVVSMLVAVSAYARYEMTHDLPNPYWGIFNRGYSYTPEQGPPSAALLDTRPDVIVMQYLHDYLATAGTYPCVGNLHGYKEDETDDPVLRGGLCSVSRPVTEMQVLAVHVSQQGWPESVPKVKVEYLINYADGTHLHGILDGYADIEYAKGYFLTVIHVKCWELGNAIGFYDNHAVSPPTGAEYFTGDGMSHCVGVN